ncbi:hypothetical protein MMC07_008686 [Pseudocyphellaria aurata]|nr:hypothetical protein [Pseudocyphellaria aurata]
MEPWQSWSIVAVVGAGAYLYYSQSGKTKHGRGRIPPVPEQTQRRNSKLRDESKGRRKRGEASGASDHVVSDVADVSSASAPVAGKDRPKKRKGEKKPPSQLAQSSAVDVDQDEGAKGGLGDAGDDGIDNKEFARQLSERKTGTSLTKPATNSETKRTKKQGKRNETLPEPAKGGLAPASGPFSAKEMSTSSSTTGADADDDLSPAMSPTLAATDSTKTAGDVSDMLESPSKGPVVLRLTPPAQPQVSRQPKAQKKAEEPLTKKQRQNRQKNEEKKAARAEIEKDRRVLMEKQLRTAREAEGRPAKNGLGSSKPPVSNAWTKSGDDAPPPPVADGNHALLDTFNSTNGSVSGDNAYKGNGTSEHKVWERDLPSEEEQMRILSEMGDNDGWNTVEKGGRGKKKAVGKPTNGEDQTVNPEEMSVLDSAKPTTDHIGSNGHHEKTSSSRTDMVESQEKSTPESNGTGMVSARRKPIEKADPSVWNRSNIHNHPDYDPEYPYALTGHPDDSDWAVV